MTVTDYSGVPLDDRLRVFRDMLAVGWRTYLESMTPAFFGPVYKPERQVDFMLRALAVGAGRWASDPGAVAGDEVADAAPLERVLRMREIDASGRDGLADALANSLAKIMHGAFGTIGLDAVDDPECRAVLVPLQLAGMRLGASQAFKRTYPPSTTLATLDSYLREALPAGVTWELDH